MRVLVAIGRIDPEVAAVVPRPKRSSPKAAPVYFGSSVLANIAPACRAKGWQADTLYVGRGGEQRIERPDVIVNLMSDALVCARSLDWLGSFARQQGVFIVNDIASSLKTSRLSLAETLKGIQGVVVPLTTRYRGTRAGLDEHIASAGHEWPVLLRPPGSHGSAGLIKRDGARPQPSESKATVDVLVTDFVDFSSADGLFRKYRYVYADRTIFKRHLIAARQWNITGEARADMVGRDDLIAAEREFLAQTDHPWDGRVREMFAASGLDLGVLDFAMAENGDIVVFEMNGTFQITDSIPPEKQERWGYLEANNGAINAAILRSIERKARAFRTR
ncbi:MAG: hypothetical protein KDE14_06450 [Rhodobacteraceae bacterium]|nr:hypothetical protein [Paracoccaceae bacterium]